MEGTPLYELIHTLERPTPINDLNENTNNISVIIHRSSEPESIVLKNLAPFHTIEDLSRAIYDKTNDSELFPKFTFLCTIDEDNYIPSMLTWIQGDTIIPYLNNPESVIQNAIEQDNFVEVDGTKRLSTNFLPKGRITLEDSYPDGLPEFHVYTLQYLLSLYKGPTPISEKDWYGLFYPYFYQLGHQENMNMDSQDEAFGKDIKNYIQTKLNLIDNLNTLLQSVDDLHELSTTNVKYLSFIWDARRSDFEGVDIFFYSIPVNEKRPYMRLLTPNITPLTKLYKPNAYGLPYVNDIALLKTWIQDKAPDPSKPCLYSKILLREDSAGLKPLYGTMAMFDEGDSKFIIQPAKDVRSLDFNNDLLQLSETLEEISNDMFLSVDNIKLAKANIVVELDFKKSPPKNINSIVGSRLKYLETIFQTISPPDGQAKPLFMLRYKGVSNFIKEDTFSEYLTYYITRKGVSDNNIKEYVIDVAREFEISQEAAFEKITQYFEKKQIMTAADSEGKDYLPLISTGTDISIVSKDINTFSLHIYNLISEKDLVRIISILSAVFFADEETWDEIFSKSANSVEKIEEVIQEKTLKVEVDDQDLLKRTAAFLDVGEDEEETEKQEEKQEKSPVVERSILPKEKIIAHKWFITRLQEIDVRLFGYPKVKGVSHYSSQCASNEDRYPAVLNESQYRRMRQLYAQAEEDGRVGFIIYGVPESDKTKTDAIGKTEKISVLRYGSDTLHPNYYLCTEYYCLRDLLPVLNADWESETYDGNIKPKNSCPFCYGTLIVDPKNPDAGQTVLRRKVKPRSREEKRHLHVGFLGEGKNPNGYDMPCCFIKEKKIGWADPRFKRFRDAPKSALEKLRDATGEEAEDKNNLLKKNLLIRTQQLVSYELLKSRLHKEYVVGSEKHPLEPGKIGMPNVGLDNYFLQDSSLFVARTAIKQEFKSNARGMFRLGVLNRVISTNDSLFSALAPILGRNTSEEVKNDLSKLITPRVFINLNFGNLLLEFFNPDDEEPTSSELSTWTQRHLLIYKPGTEFEQSRFYRSYHNFISYINNPKKKKLLRHFVHILAEPGIIVKNGLTLVTLKYIGDPRESTSSVEVLCPSLGYNIDRYEKNDVAFITYYSGIWEPLIYVSKIIPKGTTPLQQEGFYSINYMEMIKESFPQGIKDRYNEFVTQCRSTFRGAYTYQGGVDVRSLLPVTRALEILRKLKPIGLVRDSYNHLVAITLESKSGEVLVPVVDDGNSFYNNTALKIHTGLLSVELANANDVELLYTSDSMTYIGSLSTNYILDSFLQSDGITFGYSIGKNINLPCLPEIDVLKTVQEEIDDFQFEYELNREILVDGREMVYKQSPYLIQKDIIENIYQHLRLTFSRWISTQSETAKTRVFVKKLIERNDIPSFEKIRRLELELKPEIVSWLSPDPNPFNPEPVLLRSDCRVIEDPDKCTNYCQMSNGQCKIHTPEQLQISSNETMDAIEYLTRRLFDEIVRLPARANELLERGVRRVQPPKTNIQIKDQWIIPQGVPAWYDLLRMSNNTENETSVYYEEFHRSNDTAPLDEIKLVEVPDNLKSILPSEYLDKFVLRLINNEALFFDISDEIDKPFTVKILSKISLKYNKPVIRAIINKDPIEIEGRTTSSIKSLSCIVIISGLDIGPAILTTHDTLTDSIPALYIKGPLIDSIRRDTKPIIIKRKFVKN
jgi:hypothetical protein